MLIVLAFVNLGTFQVRFNDIAGIVSGLSNSRLQQEIAGALHAFDIPMISVSPHADDSLGMFTNVLTTAPDMVGQAVVSTEPFNLYNAH